MLLKVKDLSKSYYQGENIKPLSVLKNLNLELDSGQSLAISGPSGSGKTTLLNCLGTLDHFDSGELSLGKNNYKELNRVQLAKLRNREIGFIFQLHHLLPQFTLKDNILLPSRAFKNTDKEFEEIKNRTEEWAKKLKLEHRLNAYPFELSGGERQRGAVIRALVNQPRLILADEPTGNLDQKLSEDLVDLLKEVCFEITASLIMVTHSIDLSKKLDQSVILFQGQLKKQGDV